MFLLLFSVTASLYFFFKRICFFEKGFLDDQFNELQQLQDESNPEFVVEVVTLFFEDAERLLNELANTL